MYVYLTGTFCFSLPCKLRSRLSASQTAQGRKVCRRGKLVTVAAVEVGPTRLRASTLALSLWIRRCLVELRVATLWTNDDQNNNPPTCRRTHSRALCPSSRRSSRFVNSLFFYYLLGGGDDWLYLRKWVWIVSWLTEYWLDLLMNIFFSMLNWLFQHKIFFRNVIVN